MVRTISLPYNGTAQFLIGDFGSRWHYMYTFIAKKKDKKSNNRKGKAEGKVQLTILLHFYCQYPPPFESSFCN